MSLPSASISGIGKGLDNLIKHLDEANEEFDRLEQENEALKQENEKLKEALKDYNRFIKIITFGVLNTWSGNKVDKQIAKVEQMLKYK